MRRTTLPKPAPNAATPNAVAPDAQAPNEPSDPPGKGVWLNYDFAPGERTLWYEDFSGDGVGDFPRRMTFLEGNVEVVDVGGTHYLHNAGAGALVAVKLPERLPEWFTVEALVHTSGQAFHFYSSSGSSAGEFGCNAMYAWVTSGSGTESGDGHGGGGPMVACRFTIDGARGAKGYVDQSRTANQTLSEKRAAAVRQYLVDSYHVDATRLTAKGLGASKPIAPNDTPKGRQNNRRVELVRS